MDNCIFCKIIADMIPAKVRYEDDDLIVFEDIAPKAPVHLLAVPKKHFKLLADMTENDSIVLGKILKRIPDICANLGIENGFRIVLNQDDNAGQTVDHLHFHILGGKKLDWNPA